MKNETRKKMLSIAALATVTTVSLHLINKSVFAIATMHDRLNAKSGSVYKWRFGNIHYRKQGTGKPLLLIHDLNESASAYEWNRTVLELAEHHTVYTLDLIGCGRSDKPAFTYTNYLYVQLISDFVRNVIGSPCDVAVTGLSASFVTMATHADAKLFRNVIMINPAPLQTLRTAPNKGSRIRKRMIEFPILGTLFYNWHASRLHTTRNFHKRYFSKDSKCSSKNICAYHEASHLGGAKARFLYASLKANYVNIDVARVLGSLDTKITILCGENWKHSDQVIEGYSQQNASIKTCIIPGTGYLPQLEDPKHVARLIKNILA